LLWAGYATDYHPLPVSHVGVKTARSSKKRFPRRVWDAAGIFRIIAREADRMVIE